MPEPESDGDTAETDAVFSHAVDRETGAGDVAAGDAGVQATVVVTLSDSAIDGDVSRITAQLEESGLAVEQVLDFIGQIVGTSSIDDLEPLKAIEGVADVEVSQTVQLPPPGSPQ